MPGGRLTHQDREHIAAGLTDGLEYAEIARRLGRPTSTITREVIRNGGAHGYRANKASQAAGLRARRRKPTAPPIPVTAESAGRDADAVHAFEEQLTTIMVRSGFSRMPARVMACLSVTDSGSLTAAELTARLQVSPASISNAIGYLEGLDMVRRERETRRRERYAVDEEAWFRAYSASARTNAMWAEVTRRGVEIFGAATPVGSRLENVSQFFERIHHTMIRAAPPASTGDALTLLAALLHAGQPLTADELATALGWPSGRLTDALRGAGEHADIVDPVALQRLEDGTFTAVARPDRLTSAQREALGRVATGS
jgi:DNA-binding transcriptional regulator GbsR (MarR family)